MSAIRRDEDTDNIHSIYVDQWDWEKSNFQRRTQHGDTGIHCRKSIQCTQRNRSLHGNAVTIYEDPPDEISFITSQELETMYPDKTPKEREYHFAKAKGAVFIKQIGKTLASGQRHDGRAPDSMTGN